MVVFHRARFGALNKQTNTKIATCGEKCQAFLCIVRDENQLLRDTQCIATVEENSESEQSDAFQRHVEFVPPPIHKKNEKNEDKTNSRQRR